MSADFMPTDEMEPAMPSDPQQTTETRMAYIRAVKSEDVAFLYPAAPLLAPGRQVFVLHAFDGTPIVIAGSRESALADAASFQLETVSLH
jgi:hypothetical protein